MQLPEIIYGPVQTSSETADVPYRAGAQLADSVSKGLYALSNELVKQQSEDAALQLTTRLNNLKQDIASREYLTSDEARTALGGDVPGVRLTEQHIDPATGTLAERDRDMIPMYELAEPIFREQSRRIISEASQAIGSSGWRAQFQDQAQLFAEKERERVAITSIALMRHDLKLRAATTLDGYVTAGNFRAAYGFLSRTNALEPGEKEKARAEVEKQEQLYPFRIAILDGINDEEEKARTLGLIGELKTDSFGRIKPEEKAALAATLRAQVEHYDRVTKVDPFKAADEAARNAIVGYSIQNPGKKIPTKVLAPYIGKVSAGTLEHLLDFVKGTQKDVAIETDPRVYQYLSQSVTSDMEGFKSDQILLPTGERVPLMSFAGRLSKEHLITFMNLQRTVKEQGAAAARGFIDDKTLVDGVLVGNFKYDLKTTDENKIAEIGWLRIQADLALTRAQSGGQPIKAEDRLNIVRSTIASELQKKGKLLGFVPWTGGGPEVKVKDVDPAWFAVWGGRRKQRGLDVTPAHAKETYDHYAQFEAGFSAAWMAQTGEKYLPLEKSIAIYENMTYSPKPGVETAPVWKEIEAALERTNPETGRPYKDASPEVVARLRAGLAVTAYRKTLRKGRR